VEVIKKYLLDSYSLSAAAGGAKQSLLKLDPVGKDGVIAMSGDKANAEAANTALAQAKL
jgi:hypothetical protein